MKIYKIKSLIIFLFFAFLGFFGGLMFFEFLIWWFGVKLK